MIEIKDLLLRFNNLLVSEEVKKDSIRSVLVEVLGINITKGDIEIKNNTLYLNIKPIFKNEILMKKEKIFSKLKEVLGSKSPGDIR